MTIVIKNGEIVTGHGSYKSDIMLKDGIIEEIGNIGNKEGYKIIDAKNKYIFPGAIDVHTHLDLSTGSISTSDDFNTGTKAAVAGGTTMVVDFATQEKGRSLKDAVTNWDKKASKGSYCDYGYHMAIIDWNENVKKEMDDMMALGITSFKMYMAYKNSLQVDDGVIYNALKKAKNINALIGFHCENGDLVEALSSELIKQGKTTPYYHQLSRPDTLEEEAINRLGEIAKLAKSPIWVVHLSSNKGLKVVKKLKSQGINVLTETCPQYLVLDNTVYGDETNQDFQPAKYVISPPIRKKSDLEELWEGLKNGDIDFISTDHCSFNYNGQKELGKKDFTKIPNGGPGLEHRLSLIYTYGVCENKITINEMVKYLCENPAKYFGIKNKGFIEEGKDGDLVIFNPKKSDKIQSETQVQHVDYTPYEGFNRKGEIETVFLRGEKIYSDGKFTNEKPNGKYIKREKSAIFN